MFVPSVCVPCVCEWKRGRVGGGGGSKGGGGGGAVSEEKKKKRLTVIRILSLCTPNGSSGFNLLQFCSLRALLCQIDS